MAKGDPIPPLPADAPKAGEVYKHYKGDSYKTHGVAFDASLQAWAVLYEPMYEVEGVKLFTRPLSEWQGTVEWEGREVERFSKV